MRFAAYNGHYCYLKMNQRIIEESKIYSRLENIVTELISISDAESPLTNVFNNFFDHFVNDDVKEARTFEKMFQFLHEHYFFRLK